MLEKFLWIDWVILAIVVVSTLISIKRGFLKEVLSLIVWIFAVIITAMFHEKMAVLLQPYIESPSLRKAVAIITLFLCCLIVGGLINFIINHLAKITGLTVTDRLLGTIFGFLRGIVVVIMLLMIGKGLLPLHKEPWWDKSLLVPHASRLESWTVKMAADLRDALLPLIKGSVK